MIQQIKNAKNSTVNICTTLDYIELKIFGIFNSLNGIKYPRICIKIRSDILKKL